MSGFFITGTDTGVGKTVSAAVLTLALQACYWKPIQSGLADDRADLEYVREWTGLSDAHFMPTNYNLQASLSPDQAAVLENITIDLKTCVPPRQHRPLIIEGAGGLYVPLNNEASQLDLMKQLGLPVIIVSRGTLGTINHTLLTIHMLRQWGLAIQGIIFSGKLHLPSQAAIEKWGSVKTLFHIPYFENMTRTNLASWVMENKSQWIENLI
jgi:malonyl-CoA O-methyltransferase